MTTHASEPELSFVFEGRVSVSAEQHIGSGPHDRLMLIPITGGTVRGPRLNGEVVGVGVNLAPSTGNPVLHAETVAITMAAAALNLETETRLQV